MRGSYATPDHHAMEDRAKKACIGAPAPAVRDGDCGVDDDLHPPLLSGPPSRKGCKRHQFSFRKEVIQPQVLLRLPCYDFTPITSNTVDAYLLTVSTAS